MDFSKELEAAKSAAREAGEILAGYYSTGRSGKVTKKGEFDIVTEADKESELLIRERLGIFPDYGFIGEEFDSKNEKSDIVWHVDPMCGTYNFEHGNPRFAVSIALEYRKEIVIGVVYIPFFIKPGWESSRKTLFWTEKGKGAFLETISGIEQLAVSSKDMPEDAMVTTDFASEKNTRDVQLRMYGEILERCQKLR